jgi:spectinomycin phosphotransferase
VREPPEHLTDAAVLRIVRDQWLPAVTEVEHLRVGFGAHHWVARVEAEPQRFVTLDGLGPRHSAESLEVTYAAAAALHDAGLAFVVPCLRGARGTFTAPLEGGALSATRWIEGRRPPDASGAVPLVARLRATAPPRPLVRWRPLVPASFAEDLAERLGSPWAAGPMAEPAEAALAEHLIAIEAWTATYHYLADVARRREWVPTHGEPHERNLLETASGTVVVDWESLRLAPAERDLRVIDPSAGDTQMLELFDLEWRLDEISQYADWFQAPHTGTEDDRVALRGLLHELERP